MRTVRIGNRDMLSNRDTNPLLEVERGLRIIFLGTGTSTGVPEVGCHCLHCLSDDSKDRRGRCSILIVTPKGRRILIDVSPDFREQALRIGLDRVDAVILTHEHYDHIGGIDDLRTISWKEEVPIYAHPRVLRSIQARMPYIFSDNPYPGTPRLRLVEVEADTSFEVEGLEVIPIEVLHGKLPILGYRIGELAYITDMKTISSKELAKLEGVRYLIVNALRALREHPSHQSVRDVLALVEGLSHRPEQTLLTHLSHHAPTTKQLEALLPADIRPAYDDLVLELPQMPSDSAILYPYKKGEGRLRQIDCGRIAYGDALRMQHALFDEILALKKRREGDKTTSYLLMCEHNPVFTLGKHGKETNILRDTSTLEELGYEVWNIDRGGDVTYHGPGQLTGYPILDLEYLGLGLRDYIHLLEESVIVLLKRYYHLQAERDPKATGVWLDVGTPKARKICAIGVRSSRFVTMHGFALNVNTPLEPYRLINPCGFVGGKVTSIGLELGYEIDFEAVKIQLSSIMFDMLTERVAGGLDGLARQ